MLKVSEDNLRNLKFKIMNVIKKYFKILFHVKLCLQVCRSAELGNVLTGVHHKLSKNITKFEQKLVNQLANLQSE